VIVMCTTRPTPARLAASKNLRVGECLRKSEVRRPVESYPIGIDQDIDAAERFFELMRLGEVVEKRLDGLAKRIGTVRRIRERDHLAADRAGAGPCTCLRRHMRPSPRSASPWLHIEEIGCHVSGISRPASDSQVKGAPCAMNAVNAKRVPRGLLAECTCSTGRGTFSKDL